MLLCSHQKNGTSSVSHLNHVVKLDYVCVRDAAQDANLPLQALLELSAQACGVDFLDSHCLARGPVLCLPNHCK